MPSLHRRPNGIYCVSFFDATRTPKRKTVSTGETHRRKAEAVARRIEAEVLAGTRVLWKSAIIAPKARTLVPLVRPSTALSEALPLFLSTRHHLSPTTQDDYAAVIGRFVRWAPEGLESQDVSADHVAGFIRWADVKPVTQHSYRRHLRVFFRWLAAQGALAQDPTIGVALERAPLKHPRFLTPEDVTALCDAIKAPCRFGRDGSGQWLLPVVQANVYLGLRLGEVVNLRWEDVDLARRRLVVRCTDAFTTKAGRERTLPLAQAPFEVLSAMCRKSEYVFTNYSGRQVGRDHLSRTFKRYCRRADLSEEIDFHTTRHTAASWLMMQGASIEAVRQYLGHSSIMVTQRYAHLSDTAFAAQVTCALGLVDI